MSAVDPAPVHGNVEWGQRGNYTEREVLALAAVLDSQAFEIDPAASDLLRWDQRTRQATAYVHALNVFAAGFREVTERPDLVERLVWAIAGVDGYQPGELSDAGWDLYSAQARAALAALRGAERQ